MDYLRVEFIVVLLVVGAILVRLLRVIGSRTLPEFGSVQYQRHECLFSAAERSFFGVLCQALGTGFRVFGKVRVADILAPCSKLARGDWQRAFNRISSKHFDYVVCDESTLDVLFVVELNDRSHQLSKRIDRDRFLRNACESAGLPLVFVRASRSYSIADIKQMLPGVGISS